MAIALVQNPAGTHASATASITRAFVGNPVVGNYVIVLIGSWLGTGAPASFTVSDNKVGNSYSLAGSVAVATTSRISIYYAKVIGTGASFTVTIGSGNSNSGISGAIAEFSGIADTTPQDGVAVTGTGSSTASSSGSLTPSQSGDLFVGITGYNSGTTSTITPTGSLAQLVEVDEANVDQDFNASYLIATDSAAKTAQWTLSPSNTWGAVITGFKAASVSTNPVGQVVLVNHAARIRSYYW